MIYLVQAEEHSGRVLQFLTPDIVRADSEAYRHVKAARSVHVFRLNTDDMDRALHILHTYGLSNNAGWECIYAP